MQVRYQTAPTALVCINYNSIRIARKRKYRVFVGWQNCHLILRNTADVLAADFLRRTILLLNTKLQRMSETNNFMAVYRA